MIYYSSPFSTERKIGKAYNQFMKLLPNPTDYGCLIDGDTLFTTSNYGYLIEAVVNQNPNCRLFYAKTNRISCPWQLDNAIAGDDIFLHRQHGKQLMDLHGTAVKQVQGESVPGSGFFILLRKCLWEKFPFREDGMLNVDWDFFRRVVRSKEIVFQISGLYLYHWYRGGDSRDTTHLE